MRTLSIYCLPLLAIVCLASGPIPITDFNGSKVIYGLTGEPLPTSFFQTTAMEAISYFSSDLDYRATFQLSPDDKTNSTAALFINESEYENSILVTGVVLGQDRAENFLVQIQPLQELELDIAQLKNYSTIYVVSMSPFRVVFDKPLNQDGILTEELAVLQPLAPVVEELADNCGCHRVSREMVVTNYNGPGKGGSTIGYFRIAVYENQYHSKYITLNVYWPTHTRRYHRDLLQNGCPSNGSCALDRYKTGSITGRVIEWISVSGSIGWGTCKTSSAPGDSCIVLEGGQSQYAKWMLTLP